MEFLRNGDLWYGPYSALRAFVSRVWCAGTLGRRICLD